MANVMEEGGGPDVFEAAYRKRRSPADRVSDYGDAARMALRERAPVVDRVGDSPHHLRARIGKHREQARVVELQLCHQLRERAGSVLPSRFAR